MLRKNMLITAGANVVLALSGMVTGILAARLLGPHGRGELAAIQNTASFIAGFAMLGLPEALTYYSARMSEQAASYLGTASVLALIASVPCALAGFLAMPTLLNAQSPAVINAARWYLLIAPIWAVCGMLPHLARGTSHFIDWNLMRLIVPVCAVAVLLVAWLTDNVTARFIAFGNLVYNLFLFAPFFYLVSCRITGSYLPKRAMIRPLLDYGLPCALTGLPQSLNLRLDQMVMAAVMRPRDLGLYVVAVAWSGAVSPILTSVGAALMPSVASATSREHAVKQIAHGVKVACALAVLLCSAITALTPVAIVYLFGRNYRAAIPAALIAVPAAGVLGINFALQESVRGLGAPKAVLRAELLGLCATSVSLAAFLPRFGILGAAASSLLGYSVVGIALINSAMHLTNTSVKHLLIPSKHELSCGLRQVGALLKLLGAA